jgi:hypothetical protein
MGKPHALRNFLLKCFLAPPQLYRRIANKKLDIIVELAWIYEIV